MELGDSNTAERNERSRLDVVLDKLNADLAELLEAVESGGLDQLTAAQRSASGRSSRLSATGCR
jgi:hypothetical protein